MPDDAILYQLIFSTTDEGRTRAIAIRCMVCGMTSYNPHDIAERYCGSCHVFHDDRMIARGLRLPDKA